MRSQFSHQRLVALPDTRRPVRENDQRMAAAGNELIIFREPRLHREAPCFSREGAASAPRLPSLRQEPPMSEGVVERRKPPDAWFVLRTTLQGPARSRRPLGDGVDVGHL